MAAEFANEEHIPMTISKMDLDILKYNPVMFLQRFVVVDGPLIYHYTLDTKQQSSEWVEVDGVLLEGGKCSNRYKGGGDDSLDWQIMIPVERKNRHKIVLCSVL